jgi:hypothetical protein
VHVRRSDDGASTEVGVDQVLLIGATGPLAAVPAKPQVGRLLRVGSGRDFARFADLPPLAPGDVVEVAPGTYHEFLRVDVAGTAECPITVRGIGEAIIDGTGLELSGLHSRALVQIAADHCIVEGLRLNGARTPHGNASGVRLMNAATATVRDCEVSGSDLGINIHDCGAVEIERCNLVGNGTPRDGGSGANIYAERLERLSITSCRITDARGNNISSGARWTEIASSWIADGGNAEIDLLSPSSGSEQPHSGLIIGCRIQASAQRTGTRTRCVAFGNSVGGSLSLVNSTFISALPRIIYIAAATPSCSVLAYNCIFSGRAAGLVSGTTALSGSANWIVEGCPTPPGLVGTISGADPGLH